MNINSKYQDDFLFQGETIYGFGDILEFHAVQSPGKVFVTDLALEVEITYGEFNSLVNKTIALLYKNNLHEGDILSVILDNSWVFILFYMACLRSGVIINPYPANVESQDLIRYLDHVEPNLIVANEDLCTQLLKITNQYSTIEVCEEGWLAYIERFSEVFNKPKLISVNPACIYYSSGTTGNPKGILFSNRNMLANISSLVSHFKFTNEEKHLVVLPLGHTAAINYSVLPCLFLGATIVLAKEIWGIRGRFWKIIEKHKITFVEMVPTTLFIILNMPKPDKNLDLSSLRWVGCGSAPLPRNKQVEFEEKFNMRVGNLYGLSETGPTHVDYPFEGNWSPGSIGFPLSVNICKIVGDNGKELPNGEVGEIVVKGENVFVGYYKNDELYRQVVRNGFFHTGDKGYKDSFGRFYFADRAKDLIIKGGVNVHPGEIEEIIISNPAVAEVYIVGMPDQILGEEICAFVRLKNKLETASENLTSYCKQFLSAHKIPKRFIFVDSFPKGPSGKILKRKLRENYFGNGSDG